MLGAKSTCHERGACGANEAAPSAATRDEVVKPVYGCRDDLSVKSIVINMSHKSQVSL